VQRVVCSHPQSNAWIAKDADKCDRLDAFKLADLLRLIRFKEGDIRSSSRGGSSRRWCSTMMS
jgi:hypothetical protein